MEDADRAEEPDDRTAERESPKDAGGSPAFYGEWNKNYKQARRYLYGSGNVMQDFTQACTRLRALVIMLKFRSGKSASSRWGGSFVSAGSFPDRISASRMAAMEM